MDQSASASIQQFKARPFTLEELVEELTDYLSVSQLTEFERQIIPRLQQPLDPIQEPINTPVVPEEQITEVLVYEYERALTEVVGPIAAFIVQDALDSFPQISRVELIETLSAEIVNPQKAAEFKQQFLDLT